MKTIKEIAAALGVDKQRVYRYIKREHISEAHQRNGVMYYDEAAERLIIQGLSGNTVSAEAHHDVHHEAHHDTVTEALVDMLQQELEIKNEQIRELNARLAESNAALVAAQALHAGSIQQQLTDGKKKHWWSKR